MGTPYIATDKSGYPHNIFSYFSMKTYVVGTRRGASNEYPQYMFLLRNKKDISIFRMEKVPYLLLCPLEAPQQGTSNGYPHFHGGKRKKYQYFFG